MNAAKKIFFVIMVLSIFTASQTTSAYLPNDKLVATQVAFKLETTAKSNLEVVIIVKNYLNISISDVQISLNLSSVKSLVFTSCEFGVLNNDNVTLNKTITTIGEFGFTPANITYGYMTSKYLEFNVSRILNGTKIAFRYNFTSTEDGTYTLPGIQMVYYDNWGDKNEYSSSQTLKVIFNPQKEAKDPYLPDWTAGNHKTDPTIFGLILYGIPIITAVLMSVIGSIKIFSKK